jgi:putative transposase
VNRNSPTSLTFEVNPGSVVVHAGRLVVIERREGAGVVRVRDLANGLRTEVLIGNLRGREAAPVSQLPDALEEPRNRVDDKDWAVARERERVVQELLAAGRDLRPRILAASGALGVTERQIYTWMARYRAASHTSSLLDKPSGPRRGTVRLDADRERLLRVTIDEQYLKQPRLKPEEIYKEVNRRCSIAGLREISRGTVLARLRALDPETVARRRFGAKHAREKVSAAPGTFVVDNALDVMQIDHTQVDLHVVDEEFRRPLGRPWITVATDVATRMVCGLYLTLEAPSELSVALCVAHAVLPKETWLAERNINAEWPVWGAPKCVHTDNGADFKGEALRRGCENYGIQIEFRPPGRAHFGGHIERLIGTLMQRVHTLPGTSYSNPQERGDYRSEEAACLTLKELERWLALEICVHYHGAIHRTLGTSPLVAWETGIQRGVRQLLPKDPRRFHIEFLPVEDRTLQRTGVQLENIRYWSDTLPTIAGYKEPITVRYDPRDMSRIYVRGSRCTDYIDVPYADIRYPPVSLFEIKAARTVLRTRGKQRIQQHQIFQAIDAQRKIVDEARSTTREVRRAKSRRPANTIPRSGTGSAGASEGTINWDQDPAFFPVETWENAR